MKKNMKNGFFSFIKTKKGFFGPIGDDVPSIIIIIMALTLFFTGVTFALKVYNEKIDGINSLSAAVDIGRVVAGYGGITSLPDASEKALFVSKSYGLKYDVSFSGENSFYNAGNPGEVCSSKAFVFDYLIAFREELKILKIRVCR